jgi:lantibiotic modifying enzyme
MLHDPARHERLHARAWDEARVRRAIADIVADTEARFSPNGDWPLHPRDIEGGDRGRAYPLYHGACGVIWGLTYLQAIGAVALRRGYADSVAPLHGRIARWLAAYGDADASYLMGLTSSLMLDDWLTPDPAIRDRIGELIAANVDNPTRELMWGAPGTMLAALFLYERTGEPRFADLFRRNARTLRAQLEWSARDQCHVWTQHMYGRHTRYLDAVHGFVATAAVLIRGQPLIDPAAWREWEATIVNTVRRTASSAHGRVNWRPLLDARPGTPMLMQFCHGAPGFVICLADLRTDAIDDLLLAAGEAAWDAGPLRKGANLCHGTCGNGYALLKLFARTGDSHWLDRARAFAMHALDQIDDQHAAAGHRHYSLWTGDIGAAIYLWDCIRATPRFPTLDVFYAGHALRASPDAEPAG